MLAPLPRQASRVLRRGCPRATLFATTLLALTACGAADPVRDEPVETHPAAGAEDGGDDPERPERAEMAERVSESPLLSRLSDEPPPFARLSRGEALGRIGGLEPGERSRRSTRGPAVDPEDRVRRGGERPFDRAFSKCTPADIQTSARAMGVDIGYRYEIVGPVEGGCRVRSEFTRNPNPDWVGEPMTCTYDNSRGFDRAARAVILGLNRADENPYDCEGPLFELMAHPGDEPDSDRP